MGTGIPFRLLLKLHQTLAFEIIISSSSGQVCACVYVHAGVEWMDFSDVRQWVQWGWVCEVVNVWWGLILPSVHYCWLRGGERQRDWVKMDEHEHDEKRKEKRETSSWECHYRGCTTHECTVRLRFKTVWNVCMTDEKLYNLIYIVSVNSWVIVVYSISS